MMVDDLASTRPVGKPRPAWPVLVVVQLMLATALLGSAILEHNRAPAEVSQQSVLSNDDVVLAASILQAEVAEARSNIQEALFPSDERMAADFVALQVHAADLSLRRLSWDYQPRDGAVVPVDLTFEVEGAQYNLPILIYGLYRQRRTVEVTYIGIEGVSENRDTPLTSITLRYHRPPNSITAWLANSAANNVLGGNEAATLDALNAAASLELHEAFQAELPLLRAVSQRNRMDVMTALPGLLRHLPSSALSWVGMESRDGELSVLDSRP